MTQLTEPTTCIQCVWMAAEVASVATTYGRGNEPYRRACDEWGSHLSQHRLPEPYVSVFPADAYQYHSFYPDTARMR